MKDSVEINSEKGILTTEFHKLFNRTAVAVGKDLHDKAVKAIRISKRKSVVSKEETENYRKYLERKKKKMSKWEKRAYLVEIIDNVLKCEDLLPILGEEFFYKIRNKYKE